MSDMRFTWRGISSDDYGVVVTRLPPVTIAGKRDESIQVPGRSGALHRQDGAWDEVLMAIECYLPYEQGGQVAQLSEIAAWLQGIDWLTLSNRPGLRFRARRTDPVTLAPLMEGFADRVFSVAFWADPFAYEAVPAVLEETAPFSLINPGTVFSEPLIDLMAAGDVSLSVGDRTLHIAGAPGQVMIDVPGGLIYSGSINLTGSTSGDWPLTIPPGTSLVGWTGDVTRVTIQPNWRWL